MMKKFGFGCIALLLALSSAPLSGQTLDQFKRQAAQADPSYNSRVVATEHGSAATVVHSMQAQPSGTKIPGYRVRIFLDNGQCVGQRGHRPFPRNISGYSGLFVV